jgi:hypothetical protein
MYIQHYNVHIITQGQPFKGSNHGYELLDDDYRVLFAKAEVGELKMESDVPNDRLERIVRVLTSRQNVIGITIKKGEPVPYR